MMMPNLHNVTFINLWHCVLRTWLHIILFSGYNINLYVMSFPRALFLSLS